MLCLSKSAIVQVGILKIDIEGAEKTLFEDTDHLNSFLPQTKILIMEVHQEYILDETILKILAEFNFDAQIVKIEGQPSAIVAFNKTFYDN